MNDPNDRHYLEYLERHHGDVTPDGQPVTQRFATLQQAPQVQVVPVERPTCQAHSGVCVEIATLKTTVESQGKSIEALKTERGSMRAFWFALIAAAVGSGVGTAVALFAK